MAAMAQFPHTGYRHGEMNPLLSVYHWFHLSPDTQVSFIGCFHNLQHLLPLYIRTVEETPAGARGTQRRIALIFSESSSSVEIEDWGSNPGNAKFNVGYMGGTWHGFP